MSYVPAGAFVEVLDSAPTEGLGRVVTVQLYFEPDAQAAGLSS